jgi:uncharacterized protein YndB with AHSA1/START domain
VSVEPIMPYLEPLRKSVTVPGSPVVVFDLFTSHFGEWWPLTLPYSVFGDAADECGMEPRLGGEIFELSRDGRRCTWGTVVVWQPPQRVEFTWHPGRGPDAAQTVEVTFSPVDCGLTRVDLEHRGWQRLGAGAEGTRAGYDRGWAVVLGRWADFAVARSGLGS